MVLERLTRGIPIREFLNVELPRLQTLKVDLAIALEDDSILHIEFQSRNDRRMAYRMGNYHFLLAETYERELRQVVLYVGQDRMQMPSRHDNGGMHYEYDLLDI